jgi:hypothetical protein
VSRFAGALALALNLVVLGAHAVLPFRLSGDGDPRRRRLWALAAPAALLGVCLATALRIAARPDDAIAWGLTHPLAGSLPARLIAVALAALVVADLVLAAGWRRLEPAGWRVVGALGALAVLAHALGAELLRIGWGPAPSSLAALVAAAALRAPLALAAGELVVGAPRLWTTLAGPALVAAARLWPAELRAPLAGDRPTLAAAAVLLVAARFVPLALRRVAGAAGLALAVLFLVRAAEVSRILGGVERVPGWLGVP